MNKTYSFSELQEKISASGKILVALPQRPSFDQVASALSLFLSLQQSGKTVFITCPTSMTVEFNRLVGVDKITEKVHGTDLIVSFDYSSDQVEKVSYNDDNGKPNLVIQIKNGAPALLEKQARFSYAGIGADLIITLGIKDINALSQNSDYGTDNIINIDIDPLNGNFGQVNVVDSQSSSISEVVLGIISGLGLPLDVDTAQNILAGIWEKTNGLSLPRVSADTYESVAICLRLGAVKPQGSEQRKPPVFTQRQPFNQPKPQIEEKPREAQKPPVKPPADWFEPKIFKGASTA
ncbi:hypothetical protein COT64_01395 [Candidatus Shapirobacteria bacterium CG09_land_8_20_14_0_10_39_12]|uniref:Uncharacterized protein n=1 Tax=Candidatus Shapirobacteria bacterium CG09_land_8_20_14_0_10_39_12 TaxID=1974885 RepID=A0A2H0WPT5_9BACT|nr:MAG: hypothetical protein COT64_01395 [Candidatus Shapirobacteria bacterium CG09_land_8_20_14_0_10_39_12]